MSQISPPIRIVLAAALIFMAAWMTVLKPKADEPIPAAPTGNVANGRPAESTPGRLAEAAKGAADAEAAAGQAAAGVGESTGTSAAAGTATAPAAGGSAAAKPAEPKLSGVPKPIARALADHKVLALLFWNKGSADDRAVRRALAKADRWNGRVHIGAAPIQSIAKYGQIARGVDVEQSPTIVVVDRKRNATPLVGYVDTRSIDQAVVDALRASGGLFTSTYLRKVNDVCATGGRDLFATLGTSSAAGAPRAARNQSRRWQRFVADLRAVRAPARFSAFKRATVADAAEISTVLAGFASAVAGHPSHATIVGAGKSASKKLAPISRRFDSRMHEHHVVSCGSNA